MRQQHYSNTGVPCLHQAHTKTTTLKRMSQKTPTPPTFTTHPVRLAHTIPFRRARQLCQHLPPQLYGRLEPGVQRCCQPAAIRQDAQEVLKVAHHLLQGRPGNTDMQQQTRTGHPKHSTAQRSQHTDTTQCTSQAAGSGSLCEEVTRPCGHISLSSKVSRVAKVTAWRGFLSCVSDTGTAPTQHIAIDCQAAPVAPSGPVLHTTQQQECHAAVKALCCRYNSCVALLLLGLAGMPECRAAPYCCRSVLSRSLLG